jgi:hypothetical protein
MIVLKRNGTSEETYLKHGKDSKLQRLYQESSGGRRALLNLPICPRCERIGLRDKGWLERRIMRCPFCDYSGPAQCSLLEYVRSQLYK